MDAGNNPTISVIIPTLNEAGSIEATLDAVSRLQGSVEVIVVDGGSDDATREIAVARGITVMTTNCGRGAQMHTGASAARGSVLWFLHADTLVPEEGADLIVNALRDPQVVAGNFDIRFDSYRAAARFMNWLYPQFAKIGLRYGDSAIFVRREVYEQVGGFKPLPIFEDLELLGRLRKPGRFVHIPAPVVTSSRRFEGRWFVLTFGRWMVMQFAYWLGIQPRSLVRFYEPVRNNRSEDDERAKTHTGDVFGD